MLIDGLPTNVFVITVRVFGSSGIKFYVFMSLDDAMKFRSSKEIEGDNIVMGPYTADFTPSETF